MILPVQGPASAPPDTRAAARRFEAIWPQWYVRYSLDRVPFRVATLPARLRHSPAYLTAEAFIDVRGVRPDGTVRIDPEAYEALCWWDMLHPVVLFISDDRNDRWRLEPISSVTEWIASGTVRAERDRGGTQWWVVPARLIFGQEP